MKSTLCALFFFLLCSSILSQTFHLTNPEEVGLSGERLAKIKPLMQSYINEQKLSGLTTFIARHGKIVHFENFGMKDIQSQEPMTKDTIFRIFSMTKPITSVAVMILYEEGKFSLSDPISKYIPEFKDLKVFGGGTVANLVLVDPERDIKVIDLIRHTAGFSYGWEDTAVDSLYRQKAPRHPDKTLHDMIVELSDIPVLFHPGTKYHYSMSIDILGYFIQVVSGMPFEKFLTERIFKPLQMNDTAFYVPENKRHRFATLYQLTDEDSLIVGDLPDSSRFRNPPKAPSGGGGLVSTVMDYSKFAQMILNKGTYNGVRILGRQTVEYMLQDHLPDDLHVSPGTGFGIGFGIVTDPVKSEILCSPGEASWSGAANTFFWIDPAEELIYMVWTQLFPWGVYDFRHQFRVMVHSSVVE